MENLIKRGQNLFDDTHSIAAPILGQLRLIWRKPSEPTDRQDAPDKILLLQPAVGQSCSRSKECYTLECHITAASDKKLLLMVIAKQAVLSGIKQNVSQQFLLLINCAADIS